ncbi:MAG: hypothetical protein PVG09_05670, partial [Thiohalocapsa sp.]
AVILGARLISRRIPGALIAVVCAIGLSWALDLGQSVGPAPLPVGSSFSSGKLYSDSSVLM